MEQLQQDQVRVQYLGSGSNAGGAGGNYWHNYGTASVGGGAGNPAGTNLGTPTSNGNGTGGLLVIYCKSALGTGKAVSCGTQAALGFTYTGGSSGGGSVNIFLGDEGGTIGWTTSAAGGSSATPTGSFPKTGGAGGAGTVTIGTIASGTFEKQ